MAPQSSAAEGQGARGKTCLLSQALGNVQYGVPGGAGAGGWTTPGCGSNSVPCRYQRAGSLRTVSEKGRILCLKSRSSRRAQVDGVPKVQIASNEPASQQAPEQAKREEKAEQAKREGKAEQAKTEEKAPAAGETKPATDVKPAAETKPAPAPPAGAPPPLPASDPPAPSPAAEDVPTPDKAEHKVEPSGASVPAPDTPKQPSAPEFSHAPPTPLGPAHAAGQSEPAEAAGERVAAAARGEPLTHEVDPPEPAAPEPVERALEPAPFASGEAGATPLDRDSTVKAVDSELQYAAEAVRQPARTVAPPHAVLLLGSVGSLLHMSSAAVGGECPHVGDVA